MSEVKSSPDQAAPEPFATPELFREFFTLDKVVEIIGEAAYYDLFGQLEPAQRPQTLADIIHLDPSSEEFYAECAYLNHWAHQLDHDPNEEGIDNIDCHPFADDDTSTNGVEIIISCVPNLAFFQYRIDPDHPDAGYELIIIDTYFNLIYQREPGQDPYTEWTINCMADDPEYVNADGEIAFTGDHTNI